MLRLPWPERAFRASLIAQLLTALPMAAHASVGDLQDVSPAVYQAEASGYGASSEDAPSPSGASEGDSSDPPYAGDRPATGGTGESTVTNLHDAVLLAYWNNPRLLSERARLTSVGFKLPLARSAYLPRVNLRASRGYQSSTLDRLLTGRATQSAWISTASAVLTIPVLTFGRNAANERAARAEISYEKAVLKSVEADTIYDLVNAYTSVIRDRQGVQIAMENLVLLVKELNDNRDRMLAHDVTTTDVQQVETRVQQGRAELLQARNAASASEALFARVVGADAGNLAILNDFELPVKSLEEAVPYAAKNNPVIQAAQARERISRAQIDQASTERMPRLDFTATAQTTLDQPFSGNHRETDLRGEMVLSGPLYSGGELSARTSEVQATHDSDWRLIDSALRDNRAEVTDAWNLFQTQSASIDSYSRAVASAEAAYSGAVLQEKAGIRTSLDVVDLAREILNTKRSYNASLAGASIAKVRLLQALGALRFERLVPDEPVYDPDPQLNSIAKRNDLPVIGPVLRGIDGAMLGPKGRTAPIRDPASANLETTQP